MAVTRYRRAPDPLGSGTLLPESDLVWALMMLSRPDGTRQIVFYAFTRAFEEGFDEWFREKGALEAYLIEVDAAYKALGAQDYLPAMRDTARLFLGFASVGPFPTKPVTVLARRLILNRAVVGAKAARVQGAITGEQFRALGGA